MSKDKYEIDLDLVPNLRYVIIVRREKNGGTL